MTTLVTGATGNTGRQVVAELVRRGEDVRALTRDPFAAARRLPPGVETVTGTHTRPDTLGDALRGVERLHITFVRITHEQGVERLMATGVSRADAEYVVGWHADPPVESYTVDDTVERVLGRPARSFDDWLVEHADRFGKRRLAATG